MGIDVLTIPIFSDTIIAQWIVIHSISAFIGY